MLKRLTLCLQFMLILLWNGCTAHTGRPRPGEGPFGAPLPPSGEGMHLWWLVAGLAAGVILVLVIRWLLSRPSLRPGPKVLHPKELIQLETALAILEDLVACWKRRGIVVSLSDWLHKKGRKK